MPGLRDKLNAMNASAAKPAVPKISPGGLVSRVSTCPVNEEIHRLTGTSLRRIGWSGRAFDIERCLFLDTETTGLSGGAGTLAFLVGMGYVRGNTFTVEQHMIRDFSDEPELLHQVAKRLQSMDCLCTFNGRTFDMPLLKARYTLNRMRADWRELENLDLLPPARRIWKLRIGSCRLSALEEQILHAPREDDLPGSEAPQRFFDYLKTGDIAPLEDVIRHNRLDIISLTTLLLRLCQAYQNPASEPERMDVFSLGKALEKQGESAEARRLYRLSASPIRSGDIRALREKSIEAEANWRLFQLSRRNGDLEEAKACLETMIARGQLAERPYIELSKLYEHRLRDPRRALMYANKALSLTEEEAARADLMHRIDRLQAKVQKGGAPWPR